MPPAPRIRPYKDFLTPALHRRFARATALLFVLCYAEAVFIGEWDSFFWTWFPLGRAGIRTGLLFIPAFMIFILRVAQLHVGIRTSTSGFQTFTRYAIRFETIQTATWYVLSGYLFSEIYIWSASPDADLNRIKQPHWSDRRVLNEKPMYLTSYIIFVALLQTGVHLFYDYDKINMPTPKSSEAAADQKEASVVPPYVQLKSKLPGIAISALSRALGMAVISPFIYSLTIRNFSWNITRSFAKIFWNLPKSGALPAVRPFHWSVLGRTVLAGFLIIMLWEVGNAAFSAYVAQAPLKNDRPITYESKDPNGSLLTGLKGKKIQTRAFAFWELVCIAQQFQGRRKAIFEDIDRKGGSTWSQILAVCIEVIKGMDSRIAEFQAPPVAAKPTTKEDATAPLPRMGQPLKDGLKQPGDIFSTPNSKNKGVAQSIGSFAKAQGQSPPGSSPIARRLLAKAESAVLTPAQMKEVEVNGPSAVFKDRINVLLQSSFGWPFRQEYRRRIAAVVLGSPYGDVGMIVDAIDSLTRFAVCSLEEDKYGNVQRDVKLIIQTLTASVTNLETFKHKLPFHWTDVEKKAESPEVDTILASMKGGLSQLIDAFESYSSDLRLSQSEMRLAREAATPAGGEQQMEEVGR